MIRDIQNYLQIEKLKVYILITYIMECLQTPRKGFLLEKKIRVRYYPEADDNNLYFEKKISSPEGRFKNKEIIDQKKFGNLKTIGFYDENYKSCHPKIFVEYLREYFDAKDCRLTIDTNIFYSSFDDPNNKVSDLKTAVEIKALAAIC